LNEADDGAEADRRNGTSKSAWQAKHAFASQWKGASRPPRFAAHFTASI